MPSQYSDMKCSTCASNFAAETAPRDIETLVGIILPLKKYRCRGCYTRSWHIDRKLLRTPRILFWLPFWTFFIYGLVKGIANESYDIVDAGQAQPVTFEATESNQNGAASTNPVISFGEILENADTAEPVPISSASADTVDLPDTDMSGELVPVLKPADISDRSNGSDQGDELAATASESSNLKSDLASTAETASADDLISGDGDDLVQTNQSNSIALSPSDTPIEATYAQEPVESKENTEILGPAVSPPAEPPITDLTPNEPDPDVIAKAPQPAEPSSTNKEASDAAGSDQLWIFEQSAELFTLQIGSYRKRETAEAAASELELALDPLLKYQQSSDGQWQYLLYGSYESNESAQSAAETLGLKEPWIRSFKDLQTNRCKKVEPNSAEADYCNS